jgi:hypothetical protein
MCQKCLSFWTWQNTEGLGLKSVKIHQDMENCNTTFCCDTWGPDLIKRLLYIHFKNFIGLRFLLCLPLYGFYIDMPETCSIHVRVTRWINMDLFVLDWISVVCLLLSCCDWCAHHLLHVHSHPLHPLFPFALWLIGIICMSHVLGAWFMHITLLPFFTGPFITIFRISYSTDHVKNYGLVNYLLGETGKSSMSGSSFSLQLNHCYWIRGRPCLGYTIYSTKHLWFPAECC